MSAENIPALYQDTMDKPEHVFIRFQSNQIGLRIEASLNKQDWHPVEMQSWKEYESPTVRQYSACIDTERQKKDYAGMLNARGIKTTIIHNPN